MLPGALRNIVALAVLMCVTQIAVAGTTPLQYRDQVLVIDGFRLVAQVPEGYKLELLNRDLNLPRLMIFADNGDLFIGSRSGDVYRLPAPYTESEVLVKLPDYPHSIAFRPGRILIAQTNGLYGAAYELGQKTLAARAVKLIAKLPSGGGHSSRTVAIGPDGRIYTSLGISGNCSDEYIGTDYPVRKRRGGVLVLNDTGAKPEWDAFATGLRNPIGFDWHPQTGVMYAVNHGPDHWGFDLPPENFRRLDPGSFHGMPWFQFDGNDLQRDDCVRNDPPRPKEDVTIPAATFPARNGPMGMTFVPKGALDPNLVGDAIVALHGSWGTAPTGSSNGDPATRRHPKIAVVRFADGKAQRVDDLITGFQLEDGRRWARPAGVTTGPDGALYFTSDGGIHALFRLRKQQ